MLIPPRRLGFLSFSEKNIQRIVTILKWYYFVFVCLGGFVLLGGLLIGYKLPQLFNIAGIFLLPLLIYLGIKKRLTFPYCDFSEYACGLADDTP